MKKFIPLLVAGTALLAGCNQEKAADTAGSTSSPAATAAPVVDKADAIAVVNGQYIPKSTLETLEKIAPLLGLSLKVNPHPDNVPTVKKGR